LLIFLLLFCFKARPNSPDHKSFSPLAELLPPPLRKEHSKLEKKDLPSPPSILPGLSKPSLPPKPDPSSISSLSPISRPPLGILFFASLLLCFFPRHFSVIAFVSSPQTDCSSETISEPELTSFHSQALYISINLFLSGLFSAKQGRKDERTKDESVSGIGVYFFTFPFFFSFFPPFQAERSSAAMRVSRKTTHRTLLEPLGFGAQAQDHVYLSVSNNPLLPSFPLPLPTLPSSSLSGSLRSPINSRTHSA